MDPESREMSYERPVATAYVQNRSHPSEQTDSGSVDEILVDV